MKYSLRIARDEVSFTLGLISIIGWSVAEIPQLITNYREKSAEGLSITFLLTWILGDLFNLFGCWLEPATLPTQFYMAVLYVVTCGILTAQALYYGHIYHRLKYNKRQHKDPKPNKLLAPVEVIPGGGDIGGKQVNDAERSNGSDTFGGEHILSSPIPLPEIPRSGSLERELYYMSARSLSRSHTPMAGSVLAQRMNYASLHAHNSIEEPLLGGLESRQSTRPPSIKTTLCVVSVMSFLGIYNFHRSADSKLYSAFKSQNEGVVIQVGRKLLQASRMVGGGQLQEKDFEESLGIGSFLGWGMAVLYMGGRLPQIFLNIKRGNAEGLNPFMFIFALVGNATYIASIVVSSLDWSRIKPNLPWLVDAGGCLLLDTVILYQFFYFRHCKPKENKLGHYNASLDDQGIV
ncbi:uncharacterized protein LOC122277267 [Carya illinoinensis]|uniref:Vacuolar amino acid transporter YPQ1 n=1 Tax=Carya illinoinensis TaxID=32201 RepID=A0A8T1PJ99_CARIL|nr:uncharacterized protein LOC122277267 [Carya illinoinensis]KAG6641142.1 hypothetical protein CIPAW_09G052500 [Carya illinoinensis]KAG6694538.1 hypothetical protein I3842_09G052600 [Carya illinoinensis]